MGATTTGVALGLSAAGAFGCSSIFARRGLEHESFELLLLVSVLVGGVVFGTGALLTSPFETVPLEGVALAAVGGVVGSVLARSLYFVGIRYVGPGKSLSVSATQPLYVAVLAALFLGETISVGLGVGTVLLMVGVVAISRDARTETSRAGRSPLLILVPAASALAAALGTIVRKSALTMGLSAFEVGVVNMAAALAVVGPVVVGRRYPDPSVDRRALGQFLAASLLISTGMVLYFVGLNVVNASVLVPLVQTQPLFAVVLSALVLGDLEVISEYTVVGAVTIVAGAVLVVLS